MGKRPIAMPKDEFRERNDKIFFYFFLNLILNGAF